MGEDRLGFLGMGEILVDMTPMGVGDYTDIKGFYINLGGAPFNSAVAYSKLGGKSGVIGAVGSDEFGKYLKNELDKYGVDTRGLVFKEGLRTSLAFIKLREDGERDFFFYRKPWSVTADTELAKDELNAEFISKVKWLHISGMALSHEPMRETIFEAIRIAKENNVKISFDPTIRLDVWRSTKEMREVYNEVIKWADMYTLSLDEALYLYGKGNVSELADIILGNYPNLEILSLRLGKEGAYSFERKGEQTKTAYETTIKNIKIVDTTGAGDAWNAAYILALNKHWPIEKRVKFANIVATLKCRDYGAIRGLPSLEEALSYL